MDQKHYQERIKFRIVYLIIDTIQNNIHFQNLLLILITKIFKKNYDTQIKKYIL